MPYLYIARVMVKVIERTNAIALFGDAPKPQ